MSEPFARLRRFLRELKRRKVYRVAAGYLVAAFVVLQLAGLAADAFGFPSWFQPMIWVVAGLGFPLSLVVAWAFEVTPEGVRRTPEAEPGEEGPSQAQDGLSAGYKALLGLGLVAAAVAGGWYLTGGGESGETTPPLGDRSIAVLPFEALGQEEPGTFTEGMHDDLLARLSNVSDMRVISRTAVQQYRSSDKTTGEIARELGVRWVLEGAVQEMENQIQVNAQLIDPRTETHAWAESYQRDLTAHDLFDLQGEITRRIARSLEAQLTPEETDRVEREPTQSLKAHRLYAQGRRLMLSRRPDSLRRAIDRFQRAIAQDSSYARAWAGLADARSLHALHSASPETHSDSMKAALAEAEAAARRALKLNPDLAEAHASRANLYVFEHHEEGRPTGPVALRHNRRAVELKPSYAEAQHWLGGLLLRLGRPGRALEHARLAVELSPDNNSAQLGFLRALSATGRYEEALREARRLQDVFPRDTMFVQTEASALVHLKRWEEVRALAEEHRNATDDPPYWTVFYPALADAAVGDTAAARGRIEELRARGDDIQAALVHAALGELDLAFRILPEAENWRIYNRYAYPDLLSAFRADPRYEERIRQLNKYWGLNPDGSLPDSVDVSFGSRSDE